MIVSRRLVIWAAAIVVALFVVANPLGDAHHGLGRHNKFLADLGQTMFVVSLVGAVLVVVLIIVGLVQFRLRSRQARI
jgi:hypothetical protein